MHNKAAQLMQMRDRYIRPVPTYNYYYNPHAPPLADRPNGYSLYIYKEPLFNNCAIIILKLFIRYIIANAFIKLKIA